MGYEKEVIISINGNEKHFYTDNETYKHVRSSWLKYLLKLNNDVTVSFSDTQKQSILIKLSSIDYMLSNNI